MPVTHGRELQAHVVIGLFPMVADVDTAVQEAPGPNPSDAGLQAFRAAASGANLLPLFQRILSDHLTPVLASRCLVREDERTAPSFLFESVINGDQQASPNPRLNPDHDRQSHAWLTAALDRRLQT